MGVGSVEMKFNSLKFNPYFSPIGRVAVALVWLSLSTAVSASTYVLPKGDVIGQVQYATATASETLYDIARRYDVGIDALKSANSLVDPKHLTEGARILIPSRHILPTGPREGVVINLAEMRLYYYSPPEHPPEVVFKLNEVSGTQESPVVSSTSVPEVAQKIEQVQAVVPASNTAPQDQKPASPESETKASAPDNQTPPPPQDAATSAEAVAPVKIAKPEPPRPLSPLLVSTYPISVSYECLKSLRGSYKVEQRLSRPSWSVPASIKAKQPKLPNVVLPGPKNPLGNFSMVLDATDRMIHGTNQPNTIGMKGGQGCVRMYPEDVDLLIHRITTGTTVRVVNESLKHGYKNGALYLEFHKPEETPGELNLAALVNWMSNIVTAPLAVNDWQRVKMVAEGANGIAMPVVQLKAKSHRDRGWWLQLVSYKTAHSAHLLIDKIEALGVPLAINGCHDGKLCTVVAGPFKDKAYLEELRKKIKWVTGIKGRAVPYREEDDFQLPLIQQKLAEAD